MAVWGLSESQAADGGSVSEGGSIRVRGVPRPALNRPGSTGRTEVRVLFAFDRERNAILLVGGDKRDDWARWYGSNIPIADDRFDEHQAELAETQPKKTPRSKATRR